MKMQKKYIDTFLLHMETATEEIMDIFVIKEEETITISMVVSLETPEVITVVAFRVVITKIGGDQVLILVMIMIRVTLQTTTLLANEGVMEKLVVAQEVLRNVGVERIVT